MKYDITKPTSPKMPELGKGAECLKLMPFQASKRLNGSSFRFGFPFFAKNRRRRIFNN